MIVHMFAGYLQRDGNHTKKIANLDNDNCLSLYLKFIYEPKSEVNKVCAREDVNDDILTFQACRGIVGGEPKTYLTTAPANNCLYC
jgi:hypothetical protein